MQGYYRRADALYALGKVKQAYTDFKRASKVAPKSADLQQKLAECEKEVKRLRFEEALSTPVRPCDLSLSKLLLLGQTIDQRVMNVLFVSILRIFIWHTSFFSILPFMVTQLRH